MSGVDTASIATRRSSDSDILSVQTPEVPRLSHLTPLVWGLLLEWHMYMLWRTCLPFQDIYHVLVIIRACIHIIIRG